MLLDDPAASLIAFWIGPAQPFIESARSVRDLWAGSYILSRLTAQAMVPIVESRGTKAFLSPELRDHPLPECREASDEERRTACLPNRFLALIVDDPGAAEARRLAEAATRRCYEAWLKLARAVHGFLGRLVRSEVDDALAQDWDFWWDRQVADYFPIRTATLSLGDCDPATLGRLLGDGWERDRPHPAAWGRIELVNRVLDAHKAAGHFPAYQAEGDVPQKCTLLGSYEEMGPAHDARSRQFWERVAQEVHYGGTRIRAGERLCAVSLVKRFAWVAHLATELGYRTDELREGYYPDTATVAATRWLADAPALDPEVVYDTSKDKTWSGQWLHWTRPLPEAGDDERLVPSDVWRRIQDKRKQQGRPPTYFAILALDADVMHKWLQGLMTPVEPRFLQAFSTTLARYAREVCPKIVKEHRGTLVYSGGDDTLAFLATDAVLDCAAELNAAFAQQWRRELGPMTAGKIATLSAGIAVVHIKEDLRFALALARKAEQAAKQRDRDALGVAVARRSGEHTGVVVPWDLVDAVRRSLLEPFRAGASDRWLYALQAEEPTLQADAIAAEAIPAEIRRLAARADDEARRVDPGAAVALWKGYRDAMRVRPRPRGRPDEPFGEASDLAAYLTLGQTASFLTRGRD